jgi:hypothetical protein
LHRPEGRTLSYAALICHALVDDESPMGVKFNDERTALFRRWQRLVRVLSRCPVPGWGQPPAELGNVERWLGQAAVGRSVYYPIPRALTDVEEAEVQRREAIVEKATQKLAERLRDEYGVNVGSSSGCCLAERIWKTEVRRLHLWVKEVWDQANPDCKMRTSRHPMMRRYRSEVDSFCLRWHLKAWWALPTVVRSHFERVELGLDGLMNLRMFTFDVPQYRIFARLPGVSDEDFERDMARFREAAIETLERASSGSRAITVSWRPTRGQMAAAECEEGAAVVVIDWHGEKYPSQSKTDTFVSVTEHVIEECQGRLDRPLTKREKREVLRHLKPQIAEARRWFHEQGWKPRGATDLERTAKWLASRLLDPFRPWSEITRLDADEFPRVDPDLLRPRMKSCSAFAKNAELTLPQSVA